MGSSSDDDNNQRTRTPRRFRGGGSILEHVPSLQRRSGSVLEHLPAQQKGSVLERLETLSSPQQQQRGSILENVNCLPPSPQRKNRNSLRRSHGSGRRVQRSQAAVSSGTESDDDDDENQATTRSPSRRPPKKRSQEEETGDSQLERVVQSERLGRAVSDSDGGVPLVEKLKRHQAMWGLVSTTQKRNTAKSYGFTSIREFKEFMTLNISEGFVDKNDLNSIRKTRERQSISELEIVQQDEEQEEQPPTQEERRRILEEQSVAQEKRSPAQEQKPDPEADHQKVVEDKDFLAAQVGRSRDIEELQNIDDTWQSLAKTERKEIAASYGYDTITEFKVFLKSQLKAGTASLEGFCDVDAGKLQFVWQTWRLQSKDDRKKLADEHGYNTIGEFEDFLRLQQTAAQSDLTDSTRNKSKLDPPAAPPGKAKRRRKRKRY